MNTPYFTEHLAKADPDIFQAIEGEYHRQQDEIELIASENIVSRAVLEAQGSLLTNKYAEGYPGRRYYGGCQYVDVAETLAIERAKQLFNCAYVNAQPHSGSQANQGVFLALLQPGDIILGMSLSEGGHLTHGSPVNMSGKWFKVQSYGVNPLTHLVDYDEIHKKAQEVRPQLIIAGYSAYPRQLDFKKFRQIADEVGAYLLVDMAHFAGLVAAGLHPSPLPYAHVVTTTTHKTLRGPRGGLILSNEESLFKKLNSAIFPGLQGGPLMHIIAAKAVAFGEALQPAYKEYMEKVVHNAQFLAQTLAARGYPPITSGTDNHLLTVDLRTKGLKGNKAEEALGRAGIIVNKNTVPFDTQKPMVTSGLRMGSPAMTTRGFGEKEFRGVGAWICTVLDGLKEKGEEGNRLLEEGVRMEAKALAHQFPIYPELG